MSGYRLRPHHGLCIAFFRGEGYSREFTENMTEVIAALEFGDPQVELTLSGDVICRSCPFCCAGQCRSGGKASRYDSAVLRLCGLSDGQSLRWSEFRRMAEDMIIGRGRLPEVCVDCQWHTICCSQLSG